MSAATTPPPDSLIDKVRKLLAMAERTSNPNEADAFSRKAAVLIAEHRIRPEQLQEQSVGELQVDEVGLGRDLGDGPPGPSRQGSGAVVLHAAHRGSLADPAAIRAPTRRTR